MPGFSQPVRRVHGFTLIELMIVVAIVAILTRIAYPSYTAYVQRSKIGEATSTLVSLRLQLEQFYTDNNNTYGIGFIAGSTCGNTNLPIPSAAQVAGTNLYFSYTCTALNGSYLLTATGQAAQGMGGYTYTLDYQGNRQTTQFAGTSYTAKNCWWLKSGDC